MPSLLQDSPVRLETARLVLGLPPSTHAQAVANFYQANASFFAPWDPPRPPDFQTEAFWAVRLPQSRRALLEDRELRLFSFDRNSKAPRVINAMSFTNIRRGPMQACQLGYAQDEASGGRGLMQEALSAAVEYVFEELGLHRIEASYVPKNERSGQLLRRLGFTVEGYSRDYLFVGGDWRDHVHCALTNPRPVRVPGA